VNRTNAPDCTGPTLPGPPANTVPYTAAAPTAMTHGAAAFSLDGW
jgi:hypothetical protein